MPSKESVDHRSSWLASQEGITVDALLALAEDISGMDDKVAEVSLSGSPIGAVLKGSPEAVRSKLSDQSNKDFALGSVVVASGKRKLATINLDFTLGRVDVSVPQSEASHAEKAFTSAAAVLPRRKIMSDAKIAEWELRATDLMKHVESAQSELVSIQELRQKAEEEGGRVNTAAETAVRDQQTAGTAAVAADQAKDELATSMDSIRKSKEVIDSTKGEATALASEFEAKRKQFDELIDSATTSAAQVETRTEELVARNSELTKQAETLVKQADVGKGTLDNAVAAAAELVELIERSRTTAGEAEEKANASLTDINVHHDNASDLVKQTETIKAEAGDLREQASQAAEECQESVATAAKAAGEARKSLSETAQAQAQAEAARTATQKSRDEVGALQAHVKQFFDEIGDNQSKLEEWKQVSDQQLQAAEARTEQIISENQELQSEIREHLVKAVGASLFAAFDKRKSQLTGSKWVWTGLTATAVVAQVAAIIWLASEGQVDAEAGESFYSQPLFILKATVTVPLLFLIGFCVRQYGREREYEELYAFKSALSFSLSPYLDFVGDLRAKGADPKHAEFVVRTISQVFENPLEKVDKGKRRSAKDGSLANEILEKVVKLVERGTA